MGVWSFVNQAPVCCAVPETLHRGYDSGVSGARTSLGSFGQKAHLLHWPLTLANIFDAEAMCTTGSTK